MNKILKNPWFYGGIFIAVVLIYLIIPRGSSGPGPYDGFATCLTEKNVKMYGTEWCSHCQDQKKLFGKSFDYVDFVDCDENRKECLIAGVTGYPTWVIEGKNYPGEQSLQKLSALSGCEI